MYFNICGVGIDRINNNLKALLFIEELVECFLILVYSSPNVRLPLPDVKAVYKVNKQTSI